MAVMSEALRSVLSAMAEKVGLKSSDAKQLDTFAQKLASSKVANTDKLEELKEEIRTIERRCLQKKKEYEGSKGKIRDICASEIEQIFREIDLRQDRAAILAGNVQQISIAQAKIQEIKAAHLRGADENEIDEIALCAQEAFETQQIGDRAVADLQRERYKGSEKEPMDIETRLAELDVPVKSHDLSDKLKERLKELEES